MSAYGTRPAVGGNDDGAPVRTSIRSTSQMPMRFVVQKRISTFQESRRYGGYWSLGDCIWHASVRCVMVADALTHAVSALDPNPSCIHFFRSQRGLTR